MQSPIRKALLLVGGLGTRLRPLTCLRPKPLLPLLNRPLVGYQMQLCARHGVTDVVMAGSYQAEAVQAELGDGSSWGLRLHYLQEPEPLGTAGAIRNAAALLDKPFFALNGDLVHDTDLAAMARAHRQSGAWVTFCLRQVDDISAYGLVQCDDSGRVVAFREKAERDQTGSNTVNAGFYVMNPQVLEQIPTGLRYSNETQLFPDLLARGKPLLGWLPDKPGYWSDVGRVETYLQAHAALLDGAIPWVQGAVQTDAVDPLACIIAPVDIAAGAAIAAHCRIGPHVAVGEGCRIGQGAVIEHSILWPHSSVGDGAYLSNVILASGATVAPESRHADEVIMPENA